MDKKEKKEFNMGTAATAAAGGIVGGAAGVAAAESLSHNINPEQTEKPVEEQEDKPEVEQPTEQEEQVPPKRHVSHKPIVQDDPGKNNEENHLTVDASDLIVVNDVDDDGTVDMVMVDLNHNDKLDFIVDTDGNGTLDTVVLDVDIDENNNVITSSGITQNVTVEFTDEYGVLNEGNLSLQDGNLILQDDPEIHEVTSIYMPPYPEDEPFDPEDEPIGNVYGPPPGYDDIDDPDYIGYEDDPIAPVYGPDPSILNSENISEL